MDINLIRELVTVAAMGAFAGVCWWAYSPSRKDTWARKGQLDE